MENPFSVKKESGGSFPQRITFFEYLYVLVLIIYAGRANTFVSSDSITENPVGFFLPIILSGILAIRWKVMFDARFYFLIFCLAIYFIAISIKYTEIQPTFFLVYLFIFFIVYTVIKALKFDLFKIYEYLVYYLAIIGLFFWSIQLFLGGDALYFLFNRIPGIDSFSSVSGNGFNAVFYSLQPTYTTLINNFTIPRNCGFAWEPGSFAVYICLGIFINLFITNTGENNKKRFWVLLITLLSTQSTTGYMIFVLIILFYFLNRKLKIIILLLPMVIISLIYLSTLPFMGNKIIELIDETEGIDQLVENTIGRENSATPQRFTSFLIAFVDFRNNPILGLGAHREETWTYKIGSNISTITGIGNLLAQFGIVGFLFFIILSIKSSLFFSKYFNYKGKFLFFLIMLLISISYGVILLPLVMSFWMFQFFAPQRIRQEEEKNLVLNTESNLADSYQKALK